MFKIFVEGKGYLHSNTEGQEFLKFMPNYYSSLLNKEITKNEIEVYKYTKQLFKLIGESGGNLQDLDDSNKVIVKIKDMARFQVGEVVSLEKYESQKANRIELFQNSVDPQKDQKVQFIDPVVFNEDNEDKVQIAANDFLAQDVETLELELVGELVQW
jgi:hypothetical protein